MPQVVGYFRNDPRGVIVYGFRTIAQMARFVFLVRTPGFSPFQRLRLVLRYLRIDLSVQGAVTLLECLVLAESALTVAGEGCMIEVGAFRGRSTCCLSLVAELRGIPLVVIDTFQGLPAGDEPYAVSDDPARTYVFHAGEYSATQAEFAANLHHYGAAASVQVVVGDIDRIGPSLRLPGPVAFGFFDVDLLASYQACLKSLAPALRSGSIVAFHEGLLQPIRALIEDSGFWYRYGLRVKAVSYLGKGGRLRSLLAMASIGAAT